MKVTLHLEGTRQEILDQVDEFRTCIATSLSSQPPAASRGSGKAGKASKKEDTAEEPNDAEGSGLEEVEEASADDMGFGEVEEKAEPKLTIEDVQKAFREFSKSPKGGREKAIKIMGKFGVKSILEIKEADWKKAIAAVKIPA